MTLTYGSLDLQSDFIITETVQFRSMADRIVNLTEVSRRPGSKFLSEEFNSKEIKLTGKIIAPTASGLLGIVDEIQRYLALPEQALTITNGRSYTATAVRVQIPEQRYSQNMVPFAFDFISASPFALGTAVSAGFTIPSGTLVQAHTVTISGSAFAEPTLTITTGAGAGDTGTTAMVVTQQTKGESVTVSGSFSLGQIGTVFNYENSTVTTSGLLRNYTGQFSRWDVGANTFQVTVSGSNDYGVEGNLSYQPRYFS